MDYKDIILDELDVLRKKELQAGQTFKAIAYAKVIREIRALEHIRTMEDLKDVKGLGERITNRIQEILETGHLKEAEEARQDIGIDVIDTFMNIYGVGRVKATELVRKRGIKTIEALKMAVETDPSVLNDNQTIGLKYYEDLLERIPRAEMRKHERLLKKTIQKVSKDLDIQVVGSYRRGEPSSGDIDVLVKWPEGESAEKVLSKVDQIITELSKTSYIVETLAKGKKKFMGICRLPGEKARRLDLLITPEKEYGFAVLYFTGSDKFNVEMRRIVLEKGYSLNEHGLTAKEGYPTPPVLLTEEDIFQFFGYRWIAPKNRKAGISFNRYLLKKS